MKTIARSTRVVRWRAPRARLVVLSSISMAALSFASAAQADEAADTATARALGIDGVTLAEAGRCREAIEKLDRAEKLHHAPTTATRLAECEIEVGRLVVGTERLQRIVREPLAAGAHPAFAAAVARAQKALDAALPRLATLRISVHAPSGVKLAITIDEEPVSEAVLDTARRIDPGSHTVQVRAPGYLPSVLTASLGEGETKSVSLDLHPDPNPHLAVAPVDHPTAGTSSVGGSKLPAIIAFGVGAVGLGLGVYAATVVDQKADTLATRCDPSRVCPSDVRSDLRDAKTWATVSTGGFIAAGAGVATGIVLLVLASGGRVEHDHRAARVRPAIGPTSVGLDGTF